jgi:hypothetical protein
VEKESIVALSALTQTLAWIGLVLWLLSRFKRHVDTLFDVINKRIRSGAKITTPVLSLEDAPQALNTASAGAATAEGIHGAKASESIEAQLRAKNFPATISESFYLVHASRVQRERTETQFGLYKVRVWLEAYEKSQLQTVARVSYRLYNDDFPEPVVATAALTSNFELWLNVYGEFTIVAYAEFKDGTGVWLTRYLDLPGRPPE